MNLYAPIERLNRFADRVEEKYLPWWLTHNGIGDPVSWFFSHPAWVVVGSIIGALVGAVADYFIAFVLPDWKIGAVIGAWVVVAVYAFIREPLSCVEEFRIWGWEGAFRRVIRNPWCKGVQVGWLVDSLGDVIGPALMALLISWWLL